MLRMTAKIGVKEAERRAMRGFENELKAIVAAQASQRRSGRTKNLHSLLLKGRKTFGEGARPANRFFDFGIANQDAGESRERRIVQQTPELHLFFKKTEVVLARGELNRVVLRIESLDQHFPGQVTAPGAPGDLRQQLKRTLRGAKIR